MSCRVGGAGTTLRGPVASAGSWGNAPVRQIWISALSTSFKLDWSDNVNGFVLSKDGTPLKPLVARLINEHLGTDSVVLE